MSDAVDKALATLEDLSARELEATGEKLVNRRDGWREFGQFFCALADERRGQRRWGAGDLPLSSVDDRLLERIKDAEAPFWRHVREALATGRPSPSLPAGPPQRGPFHFRPGGN